MYNYFVRPVAIHGHCLYSLPHGCVSTDVLNRLCMNKYLTGYAKWKDSDQPARERSLIGLFSFFFLQI